MKVLIIGGTRFVGLAITREAIARGHEVSVFHRSETVPPRTELATHIQGDRLTDLSRLSGVDWDVVIDVCAYRPTEVDAVADELGAQISKYVLISTVSVYDDAIPPRSDEDAQLVSTEELSTLDIASVPVIEHYGALKVLCEQSASNRFHEPLIIRPTYVIGPDDYTNRFTQWVARIVRGGQVNAPEPRSAPLQYIDVRDLARFTLTAVESALTGAFHVANPSGGARFEDVLQAVVDTVGGPECELNWIPVAEAAQSDEDFPLWAQGEHASLLALDTSRALAAGLIVRDLTTTVADVQSEILSETA